MRQKRDGVKRRSWRCSHLGQAEGRSQGGVGVWGGCPCAVLGAVSRALQEARTLQSTGRLTRLGHLAIAESCSHFSTEHPDSGCWSETWEKG